MSKKELLEITKLEMEIKSEKFNKFVQILTPLAIILITTIVLMVFQRPQVIQLEAARISNEKIQIGNMLIAAQKIENPQDRRSMLDALRQSWPSYAEVNAIAQANQAVAEPLPDQDKTSNNKSETSDNQCDRIKVQYKDLSVNHEILNDNIKQELYGINGRRPGEGPFVLALRKEASEVARKLRALEKYGASIRCTLNT